MAAAVGSEDLGAVDRRLHELVAANGRIHDHECLNLNPAANVMNPRAEALLSAGLGSRPSLGHPGDKYETGLDAIEQIEIIAAELAAEVFAAPFVEIRVGSGAMANLYAFMACARPGDAIIAPPATIAGHVTHRRAGAAGLCGLEIHETPVDPDRCTVDLDALRHLAHRVRPAVITIGGSLNLCHHPVGGVRAIADEVGAVLVFDAAHLSGLIAGGAWPNPLDEGAHVMTMSCYKSLAGPPSGLFLTVDADIAERVDSTRMAGSSTVMVSPAVSATPTCSPRRSVCPTMHLPGCVSGSMRWSGADSVSTMSLLSPICSSVGSGRRGRTSSQPSPGTSPPCGRMRPECTSSARIQRAEDSGSLAVR